MKKRGLSGFGEALKKALTGRGKKISDDDQSIDSSAVTSQRTTKSETLTRNQQRLHLTPTPNVPEPQVSPSAPTVPVAKISPKPLDEESVDELEVESAGNAAALESELGYGSSLRTLGKLSVIKVGNAFLANDKPPAPISLRHDPSYWPSIGISERLSNAKMLRIGLDMGTSTTKAVVYDASLPKAWVVPFMVSAKNPYLLPTALVWGENGPRVTARPGAVRPFKWLLLTGQDTKDTRRDAATYLALVLRHVFAWVYQSTDGFYKPESTVWELRIGFPAKSLLDREKVDKYMSIVHVAIALAAKSGVIDQAMVDSELERVGEELKLERGLKRERSLVDTGILAPSAPTPEVVANIDGFYRSRQWDHHKPYGLLVDVGASTLDCSFFSISSRDGAAALNDLTHAVRPLGCHALHSRRVEWLLGELESVLHNGDARFDEFLELFLELGHDQPVPDKIQDYLVGVEFLETGPDFDFSNEVGHCVAQECLISGMRKFFQRGNQPREIPVYLSGGGSRHALYRRRLERMSNDTNTSWSLKLKNLTLPPQVETPLMVLDERDRLCAAWGLCSGDDWIIRSPEDIPPLLARVRDFSKRYVSKELT